MGALTHLLVRYEANRLPLTPNLFHHLLASCLSLTNLCLIGRFVDVNENIPPVELPHLTSIDIDLGIGFRNRDETYTRKVFSAISSPALMSLTLRGASENMINAFVDTLKNTSHLPKYPVLNHMVLYATKCSGFSRDLTDALPNITHFSLEHCNDLLAVFRALSSYDLGAEGPYNIPWPKLQTLRVNPYRFRWIDALQNIISARMGGGKPLKCIELGGVGDAEKLFRGDEYLRRNVQLEFI